MGEAGTDAIKDGKKQKECKDPVLLLYHDFFPREWRRSRDIMSDGRNECRGSCRPLQITEAELAAQELLFGIHDTFVIQPIGEHKEEHEWQVARKQCKAEPHQKVSYIKRMPYYRVCSRNIQGVGNLACRISA